LANIAVEELGKYLMIIGAIGQVLKGQMDWKRFWKRFREHTEKSGNILAFDVMLDSFISTDNTLRKLQKTYQDARHLEDEKLGSLYVDSNLNKFHLPMESVNEAIAHRALNSA
jgi:AbiV family abortive infection protein